MRPSYYNILKYLHDIVTFNIYTVRNRTNKTKCNNNNDNSTDDNCNSNNNHYMFYNNNNNS